jgi:hypothetical protein
MTPKEKAEDLVNSFYNNAESRNKIGAFDEDLHQYNCKQCALIAVDEVIEFMEADDFDSDTCYWANHSKMQYWTEVKQEIEKL